MTETPTVPPAETDDSIPASAEQETAPPVHVALSRVMAEIGAIGKNKQVQEGPARFKFRGVDDVMNAAHPVMSKHGVFVVPLVQERIAEERITSNNKKQLASVMRVVYRFYGPAGDHIDAEVWGEGQDSGDKSTGKAFSMAYKTALFQVFSIPTEDTPDPDSDSTEAMRIEPIPEETEKEITDALRAAYANPDPADAAKHVDTIFERMKALPQMPSDQYNRLGQALSATRQEISRKQQAARDAAKQDNQDNQAERDSQNADAGAQQAGDGT